jgi:anti-sigma factor RsiW
MKGKNLGLPREQLEEISAYIDGEARDPEAVQRLLDTNAEARAHYQALKRASEQVRALQAPDVHPAFATRVLANATDERMLRPRPRWWRRAAPALTAAALALLAAGGWLVLHQEPQGPTLDTAGRLEALESVIEARVAEEEVGDTLPDWTPASADFGVPIGSEADTGDAMVQPDEEFLLALEGAVPEPDTVDTLVDELDDSEAETFRTLLIDYMMEG